MLKYSRTTEITYILHLELVPGVMEKQRSSDIVCPKPQITGSEAEVS